MILKDDLDESRYTTPVILIPEGCTQFLDFTASVKVIKNVEFAFEEWKDAGQNDPASSKKVYLHAFRPNADDELIDELDATQKYKHRGYEISGVEAIAPWLNQWMPLPFFRMRDQKWEDGKGERLEYGPSNWVRGKLIRDRQNPDILHLVIAFDMEVDQKETDIYAALRKVDVDANAKFRLAWRLRDNAWFLDSPWVEEWLREAWKGWREETGDDEPEKWAFSHIANYLVYLECLKIIAAQGFSNTEEDWDVQVINPRAHPIINVDLVLDIGNSRTTGILVETVPDRTTQLKDGYLLQLRDMTEPEKIYAEPFDTRVEFCEINFGNEALNLRSGRRNPAFIWPSPVRIGPEAGRLATRSRSGTGSTGMSSPKRYLWDERNWTNSWRFNTGTNDAPYVTRGPLAQRINSSGTPLTSMEDPAFATIKPFTNQEDSPAFESFFTRSSLMMFLLVEIIHQALLTINSPAQRQRRGNLKDPRRLRQIIFTVPPGMPKAEQKIYKRWANWAVRLLWDALGWQDYYDNPDSRNMPEPGTDYRDSPIVRCEWDEATCTQLVYVYNEITRKFRGDAALFCEIMGRERSFNGKMRPSVRIATIDVGGGTTDLSITTFELASEPNSTPRMAPHPDFHDGFNLAGDDMLHNIIRDEFFGALAKVFSEKGVPNVSSELNSLFGPEVMDTSAEKRKGRTQFIRQIAVPAGLCLIDLYERSNFLSHTESVTFKLAECFVRENEKKKEDKDQPAEAAPIFNHPYPFPGKTALQYVPKMLKMPDFNILDMELTMQPKAMTQTIEATLGHILSQLCEVIKLYDCDILLLTGRPSLWDAIVNKIVSLVPVPPARIMPMARYVVDEWYPFRNAENRITDPKTTVVVGAILCALAEGQLEGFSFDPRTLTANSTARYIGQMEAYTDQIKREKVWFVVDPAKQTVTPDEGKTIVFTGPLSIGFRQLESERWTTTRYHFLDFADEEQRKKFGGKELLVTIKLNIKDEPKSSLKNDEEQELTEGEFTLIKLEEPISGLKLEKPRRINEILEMRLQTLPRNDGFWMDTGVIHFK